MRSDGRDNTKKLFSFIYIAVPLKKQKRKQNLIEWVSYLVCVQVRCRTLFQCKLSQLKVLEA